MKKLLAVILAVVLLMSAGTIGVFAAKGSFGRGFVDADEDGVCDNRGNCNGQGKGNGQCQGSGIGFTDADNDGICDNRGMCRRGRK